MIPSSVGDLEILWTVIGVFGTLNCWFLVLDSWGDLQYIKRRGLNGTRKAVARMSLQTTLVYEATQIGFAAFGVFAMTQAPANPQRQISEVGLALTVLLFVVTVLMNADAVHRRYTRHGVLEYEARREAAEADRSRQIAMLQATKDDAENDLRTLIEKHAGNGDEP